MAERAIRFIGDPVLRKKCKAITQIDASTGKLLQDLQDTLYADHGRAGLAAPQIGVLKRAAVIDLGDGLIELINPEIVEKKDSQIGHEACLSIPQVVGKVNRAKFVKVKTLNRAGEEIFIEGEGDLAVCLQHEIDHLDGILFLDHVQSGELFHNRTGKSINVLEMIRRSYA